MNVCGAPRATSTLHSTNPFSAGGVRPGRPGTSKSRLAPPPGAQAGSEPAGNRDSLRYRRRASRYRAGLAVEICEAVMDVLEPDAADT